MAKTKQAGGRGVGELLRANTTLVVWLVFLALGGGILSLYYARIGYLPDIEWRSFLVYLAAASFIGGGVGVLLALSLLLPGLIWAECLLCDPGLVKLFCYENGKELCLRTVLKYLGLPFFVALMISHFALKADQIWPSEKHLAIAYSVISILLLVVTFWVVHHRFNSHAALISEGLREERKRRYASEKETANTSARVDNQSSNTSARVEGQSRDEQGKNSIDLEVKRRLVKYSSWFALSVFLSQISMLLIYRLSGKLPWFYFFFLCGVCTVGVWISNHVVALRYGHSPRQAVAASLVAAAVLLFAADRFSLVSGVTSLSEGVMSYYGFGTDHKVTLLVNDEGATIIRSLGLPCEAWGGVYDVEILSRLGSEYYLRVGHTDDNAGRTFVLPKSTVRSFLSQ